MRPACREKVPRLTPKLFLTLDVRCEYNYINQFAEILEYISVIQWLMPMLLQMPFCPIFYKILVIMDMDENDLYDFP